MVPGEADPLARNEAVAAGLDHDASADRHGVDRSGDLDHQPAHAHHAAIYVYAVDVADLFRQRFHRKSLKFPRILHPGLTSCLPASLIIASLSLVTEEPRLHRNGNSESQESVRPAS